MNTQFTVQTIYADDGNSDQHDLPLTPTGEGEKVCTLFAEFLGDRPAGFRERLPFLTRGDYELEWAAAVGGSAFATFYESGSPVSMGVLLSGNDSGADGQMLDFFTSSPLAPLFAQTRPKTQRPLYLQVVFPERAEVTPVVQLLSTALCSVYFRAIIASRLPEGDPQP